MIYVFNIYIYNIVSIHICVVTSKSVYMMGWVVWVTIPRFEGYGAQGFSL